MIKQLEYKVFPSEEKTVFVEDNDEYGGAHYYVTQLSTGFNDGVATYVEDMTSIQFVKKDADGTMIPGVQSEQLAYILLDRCIKLNVKFPSDQNLQMIQGLNMFLNACKSRVQERIDRGVMGQLKK